MVTSDPCIHFLQTNPVDCVVPEAKKLVKTKATWCKKESNRPVPFVVKHKQGENPDVRGKSPISFSSGICFGWANIWFNRKFH